MSGPEASWEDATTNHKLLGLVWDGSCALKAQEAGGFPILSATASGTLQPDLLLLGKIPPPTASLQKESLLHQTYRGMNPNKQNMNKIRSV